MQKISWYLTVMRKFICSGTSAPFRAIFPLICAVWLLFGCSAPKSEPELPPSNPAGFSSYLNTDAQKLYAKARLLWDDSETCSDPELAMEYLEVVIALEPEYADAYMRRALAASELREWDAAFDASSRAIRLEPKADNYALRGLIFSREGNLKGARKDLERALKLAPENSRAKAYIKALEQMS